MKAYEQVEAYMQEIGLKYIKNSNDFIAGLTYRTDKNYALKVAQELNARGTGQVTSNSVFYKMKNESLTASIYISAAFDGGLFRHLGNLIIDSKELFDGKTIIDMGCDCGIVTCFIAKMYPSCRVTGVDINSSAVENGKQLAEKLSLDNVDFVCADVNDYHADDKADTICSFRGLLDICFEKTSSLPFFGEMERRENMYCQAFSGYAQAISDNLKNDGFVLSVERYTADYGWLGWMKALSACGINMNAEKCMLMRASDINSVKEYSVTLAQKSAGCSPMAAFNAVLSRDFKSGTGYEGGMAEFALYSDADGDIDIYDIFDGDKIVHQFACAKAESGKLMYYDANSTKKKIKYMNPKKKDALDKMLRDNLSVYSDEKYKIEHLTVGSAIKE
ncbi:MAG: class I SAM-dependent methyltransferase [Eubacteriales bacterium]|nr:class I SAM-dependent methyltransferase [Eubacteriales bacterium]